MKAFDFDTISAKEAIEMLSRPILHFWGAKVLVSHLGVLNVEDEVELEGLPNGTICDVCIRRDRKHPSWNPLEPEEHLERCWRKFRDCCTAFTDRESNLVVEGEIELHDKPEISHDEQAIVSRAGT